MGEGSSRKGLYPNAVSGFVQELLSVPINRRISIIRYQLPRVNRHCRPGLVTINKGYRYLREGVK